MMIERCNTESISMQGLDAVELAYVGLMLKPDGTIEKIQSKPLKGMYLVIEAFTAEDLLKIKPKEQLNS